MSTKQQHGFTLTELLIVIGIIGLLATIGFVALNIARTRAINTKVASDLSTLQKAINIMANDTEQWPGHQHLDYICQGPEYPANCATFNNYPCCDPTNNELCASPLVDDCTNTLSSPFGGLVQTDGNYNLWNGPYIANIPPDPWGNEYFFDTDYDVDQGPGQDWKAVVGSYGPNGRGNNEYDGDDIFLIVQYN